MVPSARAAAKLGCRDQRIRTYVAIDNLILDAEFLETSARFRTETSGQNGERQRIVDIAQAARMNQIWTMAKPPDFPDCGVLLQAADRATSGLPPHFF